MTKREPILDDPETLKMVKDEFAKLYPVTAQRLEDSGDPRYPRALFVWSAFRAGFEAGYWADEIPLH